MITRSPAALLLALMSCGVVFSQYQGRICTIKETSEQGICKSIYNCPAVISAIKDRRQFTRCGFEGRTEIVCCPDSNRATVATEAPVINDSSPVSQRKCREYGEAVYEYAYSLSLAADAERKKVKVDKCGFKAVPLIVGGEQAKPKEFPHMALLGFDRGENMVSWSCGGALISDQYVLTAAHCLRTQMGAPKFALLGDLDITTDDDDAEPKTFNITQVTIHPDYTGALKYNDIGLVKLDRRIKLNPYIRPACLPTSFDGPQKQAIATGWGHTEWAGKGSSHMLKVTLAKFTHQECANVYAGQNNRKLKNGIVDRTQLCAGSKSESKDTCQGDSGGPLQVYHQHEYCMYSIIGITSFGITCGNINVPGVYTRVFPYVGWIEGIVWPRQ